MLGRKIDRACITAGPIMLDLLIYAIAISMNSQQFILPIS